jgi:spore coat protein SA
VDVLVVPSQAFESFGLTCVEAMAAGVPVVATRVGGLAEVVEDGDGGYCVDRDDVAGFADRVALLLENNELRREQAVRGKQRYAQLFTADRMAQQYAAMIENPEISAAIMPTNIQEPRRQ